MKKKDIIIGFVFILLFVLIDQIIKSVVRANIQTGKTITFINHFIYFTHVENTGAAWSVGSGKTVFLIVLTFFVLAFFIYQYKDISFKDKKIFSISLILVIGGTIGNLIDRLFAKSVTDYLDVELFGWRDFPVFNFADILLVIGFFLYIFHLLVIDVIINNKSKNLENESVNYVSDTLNLNQKEISNEDLKETNGEEDEGTNRDNL